MARIALATLLAALLAACGAPAAMSEGLARLRCPPCPSGQVCVVDPRHPCQPGAACAAVCVTPVFCGGIAGFPCPAGQTCVDDPRDDCDPRSGGADCGGLCAPAH
ncbi:MAG TPA: hypothetical protein VFR85_10115 [Anaeromyxobacteraceae bacterium]|nr:hypothetical protein [Anaeromyxobacteraceae bacterium]